MLVVQTLSVLLLSRLLYELFSGQALRDVTKWGEGELFGKLQYPVYVIKFVACRRLMRVIVVDGITCTEHEHGSICFEE